MIFKIKLHWQILIALLAAIAFGYYLPNQIPYISWMEVVFLRALNMIVVPLLYFLVQQSNFSKHPENKRKYNSNNGGKCHSF